MDLPFPPEMMPCIEQFFKDCHPANARGWDSYDKVFESPLFFPLQRRNELGRMIRTARSVNPRVVMEIGADKGGGLYHWCQSLTSVERVIACEIRGTPYRHQFEAAFPHLQFLWLEEDSTTTKCGVTVADFLKFKPILDVLFIDGDKLKFVEDFDAYRPLMRPGGVVFMHDVQDNEPRAAFEVIKARGYRTDVVIDTSEATDALERADRGVPAADAHESWLRYWRGRSCGVGIIWIPNE